MKDTNKKDKHTNLIVSLILLGVSVLFILILSGVFDPAGLYVKNFLLGSFGLSFYGLTTACLLIGVLKLFKFKISAPILRIIEIIGIYCLFILAFHATSYDLMDGNNYGEYIVACYKAANTAGGVFGAIIMYPLMLVNNVFAIVIVALLLFGLIAFAMFRGKIKSTGVRTRTVKYSNKGKRTKEEAPTLVQTNNDLKNEDVDGNQLKDFKTRSRFSKSAVNYTPLEEVEEIVDEEFKVNYKDNYAYDSSNVEQEEPKMPSSNSPKPKEVDENACDGKFNKMVLDAKIARERLYGKDDEKPKYENYSDNMTDKDKFKEAIDKIRNNEDTSYIDNIKAKDSDLELYTIEGRARIFKENMERERQKQLDKEENISEEVDENKSLDFNIDDINLDDDNHEENYSFDKFEAFSQDEQVEDNANIEDDIDDNNDNVIADNNEIINEQVVIDGDIDDDVEVEDNEKPQDEVVDKSTNYEIEDFSNTLDKKFEVKSKEESRYDLPYYSRDEMYLKEDKSSDDISKHNINKSKDIEDELIEDKPKDRKRRSDLGGTHNSQHPLDEKIETKTNGNKAQGQDNEDLSAKFINPFAKMQAKEEAKVEEEVKVEEEKKPYLSNINYKYNPPPMSLLNDYEFKYEEDTYLEDKCPILIEGLKEFNVYAQVKTIVKGPTFSRIELQMDRGTGKSVKAFNNLINDIEMWLGCNGHVTIQAPIPGKSTIGIDVPNKYRRTVGLKEVLNSQEFNNPKFKIPFALGVDIDNKSHACDITKSPHMLIAGATGSGKSVGISALLNSILYRCSPEEVKLILVDPKKVELNDYRGLPHMLLKNPVSDSKQVMNVLNWLVEEMECRYDSLCEAHVANIGEYNEDMDKQKKPHMPYILLVIDEVADLMLELKKNLEDKINKLAAKSRAAGIHIVLATQRPSVDIITGSIKANLPSRIAFATVQSEDSRTILGSIGAEKLLRDGDMYYLSSSAPYPERIQGAFISKKEVVAITDYVREHNASNFDESISDYIENAGEEEEQSDTSASAEKPNDGMQIDERFVEALEAVINANTASISLLQRKLGIGYPRAGKIHDQLEECGYIEGNKVIITHMQFMKLFKQEEDN